MEDNENPFRLPPDDQIFIIRETERRRRAEERDLVKTQRVWEKSTSASRLMGKLSQRTLRDDLSMSEDGQLAPKTLRKSASEGGLGFRNMRRDKENVSDFVAKKREMFLVQMSLDVKKAEIQKLDERTKQKADALKKSQQLLDEDFLRFDSFLRQNDQKAHKAMKQAEDTTRDKQAKIQQIKTIRTQLAALQNEIARFREQKDECHRYKNFLVALTPQEWKEARHQDKLDRKRRRREAWVERKFVTSQAKMVRDIEAAERESEEKAAEQAARGRRRPKREMEEAERERERVLEERRKAIRRKYQSKEHFDSAYEEESSDEEIPLFFQESEQLLDVFTTLEESNLFMIQTGQDKEQAKEDLQRKFEETRRGGEAKTEKMLQGLQALERQIEEEKRHITELKDKLHPGGAGGSMQDQFLNELMKKTVEVNAACGHDTERDPDAIQLLTLIEAKLEEHLSCIAEAEQSGLGQLVERLEKEADIKRHNKVTQLRKQAQEKKSEDRLKQSLLRSQAPIHKKTGKQIMFRSAPLLRMRRVVAEDDGHEQAKHEHGVFGVHLQDGRIDCDEPRKPEDLS